MVGVVIGEGSFGRVVHARHKLSQVEVAIKVFDKQTMATKRWNGQQLLSSIFSERALLLDLKECSCTVDLLSAFHDDHCIYLVMECCQGGTLQHLIQQLHFNHKDANANHHNHIEFETVVSFYALQLIHAVESIHKLGISHNDICPSNILLTSQGSIRMADFGSASRLVHGTHRDGIKQDYSDNNNNQRVLGGTVDYASPEIIKGVPIALLTTGADVWSTGCVLMALLVGQSPFHADSDALAIQGIMNHVRGGTLAMPIHVGGNVPNKEKWKELIEAMLHPDPQKRLGANAGLRGGQHKGGSIVCYIPGYKSINVEGDPPFTPAEPQWVQEAKQSTMRDGSRGWTSFLL